LDICHAEVDKIKIAYKSDMSFKAIDPYLELLIEDGLISTQSKNGIQVCKATEKGIKICSSIISLLAVAKKLPY